MNSHSLSQTGSSYFSLEGKREKELESGQKKLEAWTGIEPV
jgi:hypothetical protein